MIMLMFFYEILYVSSILDTLQTVLVSWISLNTPRGISPPFNLDQKVYIKTWDYLVWM